MFGIGTLGSGGATLLDPRFVLCEVAAVGFGAGFLHHIRNTAAPFIATKLLYGKGFLAMNVINLMLGSAVLGMGALVPLYAQDRFHISSLSAGSLLTARAIGMICVAGLAVLALRRSGYRRPMAGGFLLLAVGLGVISLQPHGLSAYLWIAGGSALAGLGMGLSLPAANNAMLQLAPAQIAAVAGLRGMFRQTGGIVAVSVTTATLARSSDPGTALVFLIFAILVLLMLPTILLVPEFKGSW
jgi:MFS family permease